MNVELVMIAFSLGFGNICYSIVGIFRIRFWNLNFKKLVLTSMCLVLCILNTL